MSHLTSTLIGMAAMFMCGWTARGMVEHRRRCREVDTALEFTEELSAKLQKLNQQLNVPFRALPEHLAAEVQRLEQEHPR